MKPLLLVRQSLASKYELRFAEKYFPLVESRMECRERLVIGRYSVLPFYDELERDLKLVHARLINTWEEHQWISSFDYYQALQAYTPQSWNEEEFRLCQVEGPFVVKGRRSSKKRQWNTHMFAPTKRDAWKVAQRLKEDGDIFEQGVIFRRYIPLKTYQVGHNGLPFTNEWRFFFLKETLLSYGYYWSMADSAPLATLPAEAIELARELARIASRFTTFFCLDLAETEAGTWILIELNDGQMAVPSENDLDELYGNLQLALSAQKY